MFLDAEQFISTSNFLIAIRRPFVSADAEYVAAAALVGACCELR